MTKILTQDSLFFVFTLLGSASFAVAFKVPKRYFAHAVILAFCGRVALTVLESEHQIALATLAVAFIIALISHLLARYTSAPSQAFLIPGIIFLVPGTYIYRAFSAALADHTAEAVHHVLTVMSVATAISFALLLANWIFPSRKSL